VVVGGGVEVPVAVVVAGAVDVPVDVVVAGVVRGSVDVVPGTGMVVVPAEVVPGGMA
jgi:hypothetical protein